MIKFVSIDITSFRSIFHCKLNFNDLNNGLYSLEGINNISKFAHSNGSGKSTLLNAIAYALYGSLDDSSIKKADYQNQNTNIKLKVALELEIQDEQYEIERTDKNFFLYKNGENISEQTKTETDKKFQNILQLTKAEFFNFTYLTQTGNGSFLSKTPSEKLSCIKDFIFGEELLQIQDKLQILTKSINTNLQILQLEEAENKGKLKTLNEVKAKLSIKQYDYTLDEYNQQLKILQEKINIFNKLSKEKQMLQYEQNKYTNKLYELKQQYKKVKENICPICGQTLKDDKVLLDLKANALKYKKELNNIESKLQSIKLNTQEYEQLINSYDKIKNIIQEIKMQQKYQLEYKNLLKNVDDLNLELENYKIKIEELDFKQQQLKILNKYFKTDFVSHIQQAFLMEIENYLNLYCYDVFKEDFKLIFSNNSLELMLGDKPYHYFSGGERQRIDFIFVFAIKVALNSFTNKCTNLFICDESLSGQDSTAFLNCIELINNLSKSEELTTILVSHREIEQNINKICIERFKNKTQLNILK